MSFDGNGNRRAAEFGEALLKVLVSTYTWRMFVQLCELFYETHNPLLVYGGLAVDPLCLSECVLNVVETGGRTVHFRDFRRVAQVFVILHNFGLQSAVLVEFLIKIKVYYYLT